MSGGSYFEEPTATPEDPRLRSWNSWWAAEGVDRIEVRITQDSDGLVTGPPMLHVFFMKGGDDSESDHTEWTRELDCWLLDQHARAQDEDEAVEKLRFSLHIKAEFKPALRKYGDGYFSAVLVHQVANGDLREHPDIVDVMQYINVYKPSEDAWAESDEMILNAVRAVAMRIMALYDNSQEKAWSLLGGAMAKFLDERFSVTNRKKLGLV